MTFPTRTKPTRRQIANHLEGLSALHKGTTPNFLPTRQPVKRGKQKESAVNDLLIKAARLIYRATLWRNRRGMVRLPNGGMFPYGLGPNGMPDNCGVTPVKITAAMVGRTVGVATFIEAKTTTGVVADHQVECIENLRDMGCIAGVACDEEQLAGIYTRWFSQHAGDER